MMQPIINYCKMNNITEIVMQNIDFKSIENKLFEQYQKENTLNQELSEMTVYSLKKKIIELKEELGRRDRLTDSDLNITESNKYIVSKAIEAACMTFGLYSLDKKLRKREYVWARFHAIALIEFHTDEDHSTLGKLVNLHRTSIYPSLTKHDTLVAMKDDVYMEYWNKTKDYFYEQLSASLLSFERIDDIYV